MCIVGIEPEACVAEQHIAGGGGVIVERSVTERFPSVRLYTQRFFDYAALRLPSEHRQNDKRVAFIYRMYMVGPKPPGCTLELNLNYTGVSLYIC